MALDSPWPLSFAYSVNSCSQKRFRLFLDGCCEQCCSGERGLTRMQAIPVNAVLLER
jgi:hypothetical protein